jgi:acyl carrier protein
MRTLNESEAIMTFNSLSFGQQISAMGGNEADEIRALVAKHLDIDIKFVTNEALLTEDLEVDWLDRLELMIRIEDEFADVEISDDDFDQIQTVGDLIRYIEDAQVGCRRASAA